MEEDDKADGKKEGEERNKDEKKRFSFFNRKNNTNKSLSDSTIKKASEAYSSSDGMKVDERAGAAKADEGLSMVADNKNVNDKKVVDEARAIQGGFDEQLRQAASMIGFRKKRQSSASSTSISASAVPVVRLQSANSFDEGSSKKVSLVLSTSPEPVSRAVFPAMMDIGDETSSLQPNMVASPVIPDVGLQNAYSITGYTPPVPRLNQRIVGAESTPPSIPAQRSPPSIPAQHSPPHEGTRNDGQIPVLGGSSDRRNLSQEERNLSCSS